MFSPWCHCGVISQVISTIIESGTPWYCVYWGNSVGDNCASLWLQRLSSTSFHHHSPWKLLVWDGMGISLVKSTSTISESTHWGSSPGLYLLFLLPILSLLLLLLLHLIEGLLERTEHLNVFLFFCPSLGVLFPMFCLLVEGECQILGFKILLVKVLIIRLIYWTNVCIF